MKIMMKNMLVKILESSQFSNIKVVSFKLSNPDSLGVNQLTSIRPSHKFEIKETQGY